MKSLVVNSRDVTGQKKGAGSLSETESRFQALAESASEAIIEIDETSTILYVNRATETIFGYSCAELIGSHLTILMPPRVREAHKDALKRYIETGKRGVNWSSLELEGLHKSGREFPIQVSFGEYVRGEQHFFTGIVHEISNRKKAERRLATLYAVTRTLMGSWNVSEAIPRVLKAVCEGIGWEAAELWLAKDGMLQSAGTWYASSLNVVESSFPRGDFYFQPGQGLIGTVWQTGEGRWIENLRQDILFHRSVLGRKLSLHSVLVVPVRSLEKIIGIMAVYSTHPQERDLELLHMLETLGKQIGDLIERKKGEEDRAQLLFKEQSARAAALESERRLAFLADASLILSSSLDYAGTLAQVARLVVPRIADWCAIDILMEDGSIERVTLVHRDPEKSGVPDEFRFRYSSRGSSQRGTVKVIRTGKPELYPEVTESMIPTMSESHDFASTLKRLGLHSAMIVPLRMRGLTLGAITFASSESRRVFGPADLTLAEDLARRAAVAVDNARLYKKTQDALLQLQLKAEEIQHLNEDLERRVLERTAQLEAANNELEGFSYSVSHDLRAPLRSIHGFTKILIEEHGGHLDDEGKRLLGIVLSSSLKMGNLIDNLLKFSRIGRQLMQFAVIDMTRLTQEVYDDLKMSESERSLQIDIDPLPPARGDIALIRQVLTNVLSNALKFTRTKEPSIIEIRGSRGQGWNMYSVRDNGVGFDMRHADKIFGVFQRLHRDDEFEGTGVGLALVQRIINRHGGTVQAHSKLQEGTTIRFTLPDGSIERSESTGGDFAYEGPRA